LKTAAASETAKNEPSVTRKEIKVDTKILNSYIGEYGLFPGVTVVIGKERDHLTVQATGRPKETLYPSSETEFFVKVADAGLTFAKPVQGTCEQLTVHLNGDHLPAKRLAPPVLTTAQTGEYVGDYYSDELNVVYIVTAEADKLNVQFPRGKYEMRPITSDEFDVSYPIGRMKFARGADKSVTGLSLDAGRVRNLRFVRVKLTSGQ
jgi:hypothetical protein